MTVESATGPTRLARAVEVIASGVKACEAYGRQDLAQRLRAARQRLADPAVHIVVAGEFKQGKSSLVNALVGANACPVDDDVATAVPTYVRFGDEVSAELLFDGDPPARERIELDQVRSHVVEGGQSQTRADGRRVAGVEVRVPRKLLAGGVVLVDSPGVGGLGSAHAAASLAAIAAANAVVFVTDASQELTRTELDFLRRARDGCDAVLLVVTKADFYPAWRRIKEIDERHVGALGVPVVAVSSTLRARAAASNDTALNTESGYPDVVAFVAERIRGGAANRLAAEGAGEVIAAADQIIAAFEAERTALTDPAEAEHVIARLTATRDRIEGLRTAAAKWNQTLTDGIADLNADIEHDLRGRIRQITQEADDAIDQSDPADTWSQTQPWLESRVAYELLTNYTTLRSRADDLSEQVAEHFREASEAVFSELGVYNPAPLATQARVEHKIELDKMKAGKQAFVALKSAAGGALMFTMMSSLAGIALGPIGLGIGLVMGHKGLRDEKKRQLAQRQTQAKNAIRRYCDEVSFIASKDSRDTIRRVQRQLRDHYSNLAAEYNRSNAEALTAATEAAKRTQAERERRLRDLDAELTRLRKLRELAMEVTT
jgi:hypothetical protein